MKKIVAATLLFLGLVTFSACGDTSGEKSSVSDISYFSSSDIESSQTEPLNSEVSDFSENSDLSDTSPLKNDEFSDEKIQTSIVSDDISAYEIAKNNGFEGNDKEWLDSLKNQKADEIILKYGSAEIIENSEKNHLDNDETKNDETELKVKGANISSNGSLEIELNNGTVIDLGRKATDESDSKSHIVKFLDYDGTEIKTENVNSGQSATAPENPIREGYIFIGWDKTFDEITGDVNVTAQYIMTSEPFFMVEEVSAESGQSDVAIKITYNNSPGIASFKLSASFGNLLTLKKIAYKSNLVGQTMLPQYYTSPVTLIWINPFSEIKGNDTIATLYFDLDESARGTFPVTITYDADDVYNMEEKNIKFAKINGGIVVE